MSDEQLRYEEEKYHYEMDCEEMSNLSPIQPMTTELTITADPILTIAVRGEVINSNAAEWLAFIRARLAEINRSPKTDEEFGEAEQVVKALALAEDDIKAAKERALADAEQLHALFSQLDSGKAEIAAARLELSRVITSRKEEVKNDIIAEFLALYDIDPRDARRAFLPGLRDAIKGKRTLDSMRAACRAYQAATAASIAEARAMIDRFETAHGNTLTLDRRELELKSPELVESELRRRLDAKKAAEEKARLEKDAAEARAAEAKAKAEAEAAKVSPAPPATMRGMLPPSDLPAPPKIGGIPVGRPPEEFVAAGITVEAEWEMFGALVRESFDPIRTARANLTHQSNQTRAAAFAAAVGEAWKNAKP